jgi:hypothetical protein
LFSAAIAVDSTPVEPSEIPATAGCATATDDPEEGWPLRTAVESWPEEHDAVTATSMSTIRSTLALLDRLIVVRNVRTRGSFPGMIAPRARGERQPRHCAEILDKDCVAAESLVAEETYAHQVLTEALLEGRPEDFRR